MAKMWAGRTDGAVSKEADDFNSSIHFDSRMFRQDIHGSMAHATMLAACGILTDAERDAILDGLSDILSDLESGKLPIDPAAEGLASPSCPCWPPKKTLKAASFPLTLRQRISICSWRQS